MNKKSDWKLVPHSYQIADTGDYVGHYEITNGNISIFTRDDDDESLEDVIKSLNDCGCEFYLDDSFEYEAHILREENKRLYHMINNGISFDDIRKDISKDIENEKKLF